MTSAGIGRVAENLDAVLKDNVAKASVDVLVLGPDPRNRDLDAARLRKEIVKRCQASGTSVMAEHKELIEVARKMLGSGHNLCTYEVALAKVCDLIVLLPASPGSFAEAGLFAMRKEACAKSLVLFDREYSNDESYLMLGPARSFEFRRAKVEYVDYTKVDEVWKLVEAAIEQVKATKVDDELFSTGPQ